jgi:hypothetical protein
MTDVVLGVDVSEKTLDTTIMVGGKLRSRRWSAEGFAPGGSQILPTADAS